MIFFSSDPDFERFYEGFTKNGLKVDLLVTESPKKQGRHQEISPNVAHAFAIKEGIEVRYYDKLDKIAQQELGKMIPEDKLGFIFAYGKMIPENIINLFPNGILNIHFSLLPEYPGASPIQQALIDDISETGYTVFEITSALDQGKLLIQKKARILPDDNFDSLRSKIISKAIEELPDVIKKYLNWEIKLTELPKLKAVFTHRISKQDGLITDQDNARSAYNKIRAFSRWPKTYLIIDGKRFIIHSAKLVSGRLEIEKIQPEGKNPMDFDQFKNGYQALLTKIPQFVKLN